MLWMSYLQQADEKISWVWYLLLVMVVLGLILWWIYQQSKKQSKQEQKPVKQQAQQQPKLPEKEAVEDDLTRIEGIGPKVAKVLKDAGITSFDSLSRADAAEVKSVLNEAGLRMMNPEGWIEQAQLAANGDWDGLQKLQDELKGGRRR